MLSDACVYLCVVRVSRGACSPLAISHQFRDSLKHGLLRQRNSNNSNVYVDLAISSLMAPEVSNRLYKNVTHNGGCIRCCHMQEKMTPIRLYFKARSSSQHVDTATGLSSVQHVSSLYAWSNNIRYLTILCLNIFMYTSIHQVHGCIGIVFSVKHFNLLICYITNCG